MRFPDQNDPRVRAGAVALMKAWFPESQGGDESEVSALKDAAVVIQALDALTHNGYVDPMRLQAALTVLPFHREANRGKHHNSLRDRDRAIDDAIEEADAVLAKLGAKRSAGVER